MDHMSNDNFRNRGAVEQESPDQLGNLDFRGQLGHRNKGPLLDSFDTDFPEPGENPEHTGEFVMARNLSGPSEDNRKENEELDKDQVDQDQGMRQKQNHHKRNDDPLAA